MATRSALLATLLLSALPTVRLSAQAPRLVDSIEAPLAYLCLAGTVAPSGAVAGDTAKAGPVQRLLADPSLDALFAAPTVPGAAPARAFGLIRGLLARSSGELEIVLTGVMSSAGTPLLVLRARLQPREADKLQSLFSDPKFALPQRQLGGHQTFRLRGGDGAGRDDERGREAAGREAEALGVGELVELALLGNDLVAGNDGSAMREVLEPPPAVTSASPRRVLSADPGFVMMQRQLHADSAAPAAAALGPGSLCIYGDWQRLAGRVGALEGLSGDLLAASGLGAARSVMLAVAPGQSTEFVASLLLDFDAQAAPERRGGRAERDGGAEGPGGPGGPGRPFGRGPGFGGIDGWFAAARPVPARSLVAELPGASGLGGLVLSVDFEAVVDRSRGGDHIVRDLQRAFDDYGLSFDRNVRARLGSRGTVQFHLGHGAAGGTEVTSIFALRAKDKKAAADLFSDLRRVVEASSIGRLLPGGVVGKDRRTPDVLRLQDRHHDDGIVLAVLEDSLLIAADHEALVQAHDDLRRGSKPRGRRDQFVSSRVAAIGSEDVAGLFDVDLAPLFEQIAKVFADAGAKVDLSPLPRRHVGALDIVEREAGGRATEDPAGTMVRIRVLSSR
ncbi:MAG: hypothetical protein K8J09_22315 [Planctomycetes bacterium]|nr:hypothetical protein [Planctomycetota bacterium]MCC7399659.1 hypothetical protein [Planctomycetota bacterium]